MQKLVWNDFLLLSIDEWRQRLQAVVQNTGAHIEHRFKWLNVWLCVLVLNCAYVLLSMHTPGLRSAVTVFHRRNF